MMLRLLLSAAVVCTAVPTMAQEAPARGPERINQVIVYGDDACPPPPDGSDDIVVCARLDEGERYRIPEALRGNPNDPARESWTARVRSLERIGRTGTESCSAVGPGGFTGCFSQLIDQSYAERAQAAGTDWSVAVAEARRERMEGFDAASNEVEAQIARDEAARIAREQAAEAEAEGVDSEPLPAPVSGDGPGT